MKTTLKLTNLFIIGLLFLSFSVLAQTGHVVDGTVFDKNTNESLPGVQVVLKGTHRGTTTDIDGNFRIEVEDNQILVFSMLGYETLEQTVGEITTMHIELVPTAYDLGEVVVTALGISRETRSLAYSTQNLSRDKIEIRDNSSNVLSSLSGKVSGAVVTTAATGPGAAARVVLRGNRSISGNNTALIVVDGVAYDNSSPGQATGTNYNYGGSDGAANINPDDIESINILKGPSAAALYGSRAANGAIVITTRKGSEDSFRIDYNGGITMDVPNILIDFQNTFGRGNGGVYAENAGESWGDKRQTYPDNVRGFFNNAFSSNNSVSLSGGSKYLKGYTSYTNNYITGVIPGNKMNRHTLNLRVNTNFFEKISTDTKLTYVNQSIKDRPRLGDAGTPLEAYIMPRDMDEAELKDYETINPINGEPLRKYWTTSSIYDNPYWSTNRTSVNEQRDRVTLLGSATYQPVDWLSITGRISYDQYNDKTDGSFFDGTVSLGDVKEGGKYFEKRSQYRERNMDILVSGNNSFLSDKFGISYNLGASSLYRTYSIVEDMANGLSIPNRFSLTAAATPSFNTVDGYERMLNSVYGQIQLDFRRYLFLDFTARNDWSSTLPPPHSYFYPSVGLSAVISDMADLPKWISFGKIRASYTQVGNDPEPYLLNQRYRFLLGAGKGFISRESNRSIPDLKPEQTKSFEVGMDWRFLNSRLNADITLYRSNTINQLLYVGLPMASGFGRRYINAGNIENKGLEFQLNAIPVETVDFTWNSTLNFSTNSNKVIELAPNTTQTNITDNTKYATVIVKEGSAYGDLYGSKWKIDEKTGKHLVDEEGLPIHETNQYLGNFNPDFMFGWSNSFRYKQFNLSFLIDARIGGEMVSGTDAYMAAYGLASYTGNHREGGLVLDAIHNDGSQNTTAINAQQLWTRVSQSRDAWGEFFTYDMTNVRLRELSLAYDFKINSDYIKSAQIALTGRNLFFFYRGKAKLDIDGVGKRVIPTDPDASLGAGNYQGVELGLPPVTRSFGVNVKLTF